MIHDTTELNILKDLEHYQSMSGSLNMNLKLRYHPIHTTEYYCPCPSYAQPTDMGIRETGEKTVQNYFQSISVNSLYVGAKKEKSKNTGMHKNS